eukprot:TRINITY_DN26378_c0_g1_i2.p1 TRINITY_DN26378_c0_g1~~TRINITY_DN26378_c0_g1_i2.p1  ORF type:complete len:507 (+),score=91.08 TRINITY_DN26378_c0_g1_i2:251-1771(+)
MAINLDLVMDLVMDLAMDRMVIHLVITAVGCAALYLARNHINHVLDLDAPDDLPDGIREQRRALAAHRLRLLRLTLSGTRLVWAVSVGYWHGHGFFAWAVLVFFITSRPSYTVCNWFHRLFLFPIIFAFTQTDESLLGPSDRLPMACYLCVTRATSGLIITESFTEYLVNSIFVTVLAAHPDRACPTQQAATCLIAGFSLVLWRHNVRNRGKAHMSQESTQKILFLAAAPTSILYVAWLLPHIPAEEATQMLSRVGCTGVVVSATLLIISGGWGLELADTTLGLRVVTRERLHDWNVNDWNRRLADYFRLLTETGLSIRLAFKGLHGLWTWAMVLEAGGLVVLSIVPPQFKTMCWAVRLLPLVTLPLVLPEPWIEILGIPLGYTDHSYPIMFCGLHTLFCVLMLRSPLEHIAEMLYMLSVACVVVIPGHMGRVWIFAAILFVLVVSVVWIVVVHQSSDGYPASGRYRLWEDECASVHSHGSEGDTDCCTEGNCTCLLYTSPSPRDS